MGGAHSKCKDLAKRCTEIYIRPNSYENALLSFGSRNLTSREKVLLHSGNHSQIIWGGGGGGELERLGGKRPPPPPPPLDRTLHTTPLIFR